MKKILDLGCGDKKKKNALGFDCIKLEGVDVVGNLNDPLPFDDNSFDYVYLDNVLEHVERVEAVLGEVHRITKPTGYVLISVPFYNCPSGIDDPTHKHLFSYKTFDYFTGDACFNYYFPFKFKMIKKELTKTRLGNLFPEKILLRINPYINNLILMISVVLQPVKD